MNRHFSSGNVLVEYAFPIALIGIACIGALILIGTSSNGFLNGMSTQMGDSKTVQLMANGSGSNKATLDPTSQNISGNDTSNLTAPFQPSDTSKSIDTTGSNGTTELLATQIWTATQESLAKGEITQEQANQLQELANQGYRLSKIQAAVEDAFANDQSIVDFEGKKYSIYDLAHTLNAYDELRDKTVTATANIRSLNADNVGTELRNFVISYNDAKNSGALSNSTVNTKVTGLSNQISTISDNMAESIFRLTQTNEKSSVSNISSSADRTQYLQSMTSGLFNSFYDLPKNSTASSGVTNQSSVAICIAGAKNNGQSKKCGK